MVYIPRAARIAGELAIRICNGEFPPGTPLPSQGQLIAEHAAAKGTIVDAMRRLHTAGLTQTIHGLGVFVTDTSAAPVGELLTAARMCRTATTSGLHTGATGGLAAHVNPDVLAWMAEAFTRDALCALDGDTIDKGTLTAARAICTGRMHVE